MPDAEGDHARHLRGPARDVDEVGDERHRADAEREAEERHRRSGAPSAMNDPNATSRMITAAITPISSPMPVSASSNAKNRSPPISICSDEPSRSSAPSSLRFSRSLAVSSSITGYWMRISAMRPSGETEPLAAAASGRRPARRPDRWCRARWGGRRPAPRPRPGRPRLRRIEEGHAVVERRHDHLCGQPGSVRLGRRQQVDGLLRVEPGHLEGVLQLAARRTRTAPRTSTRHGEPDPMTTQGRRAANRPNR